MAPSARLRRGAQLLSSSQMHALLLEGVLSIAILVVASIWDQETDGAQSSAHDGIDQAELVWYLGTMAMLSAVHAMAELLLLLLRRPLSAALTLVAVVVLASGWIAQAGFWVGCEVVEGRLPRYCPGFSILGRLDALDRGMVLARVVLGWALVSFYLVSIGFASIAVHYERVLKMDALLKMRESIPTPPASDRGIVLNGSTV